MRRLLFAAALVVPTALVPAAVVPALADDDVPGCENASSNVEIGNCVAAAYQKADAALNAAWKKALAVIDASSGDMPADALAEWKSTLTAGQRAWVTFKEEDCGAVEYEWWGGSGASIAETTCLYEHTTHRLKQLEERYGDR
ncbi:MAG: DUF1311 domain-containing protein [Rhizobiales bacterium]|nr:DUF1311 domain-containing protein [Hyphomicrobiales bacterium]